MDRITLEPGKRGGRLVAEGRVGDITGASKARSKAHITRIMPVLASLCPEMLFHRFLRICIG